VSKWDGLSGLIDFEPQTANVVVRVGGREWPEVVPEEDAEELMEGDVDGLWHVFGDYLDRVRLEMDWVDVTFDVHWCQVRERPWAEFTVHDA
jgi:hypothetical protein